MKIDQDLRAAINAAAKAQPEYSHDTERLQIEQCVSALLKKRPAVKRKADALIEEAITLRDKKAVIDGKLDALLKPLGLKAYDFKITANFRRDLDDEDAQKFIANGGELPPPSKRKWKAETVISRLASAEPKSRNAILKEYNINWT